MNVTHKGHSARVLHRGRCEWPGCPHGESCVRLLLDDGRDINTHATEVLDDQGRPLEFPGQLSFGDVA